MADTHLSAKKRTNNPNEDWVHTRPSGLPLPGDGAPLFLAVKCLSAVAAHTVFKWKLWLSWWRRVACEQQLNCQEHEGCGIETKRWGPNWMLCLQNHNKQSYRLYLWSKCVRSTEIAPDAKGTCLFNMTKSIRTISCVFCENVIQPKSWLTLQHNPFFWPFVHPYIRHIWMRKNIYYVCKNIILLNILMLS